MKIQKLSYWLLVSAMLTVAAVVLLPSYFIIRTQMINFIKERLKSNASAAALAYDGDLLEKMKENPKEEWAEEVIKIQKTNTRLESIHPDVRFVYVMYKNKNGQPAFLVDSISVDKDGDGVVSASEKSASRGEVYQNPPKEMVNGFLLPSADEEVNTDRWGTFLSGYAPIYNSKNEVVAMVGLDMQVEVVKEKLRAFHLTVLLAVFTAIGLSLVLSYLLHKKMA